MIDRDSLKTISRTWRWAWASSRRRAGRPTATVDTEMPRSLRGDESPSGHRAERRRRVTCSEVDQHLINGATTPSTTLGSHGETWPTTITVSPRQWLDKWVTTSPSHLARETAAGDRGVSRRWTRPAGGPASVRRRRWSASTSAIRRGGVPDGSRSQSEIRAIRISCGKWNPNTVPSTSSSMMAVSSVNGSRSSASRPCSLVYARAVSTSSRTPYVPPEPYQDHTHQFHRVGWHKVDDVSGTTIPQLDPGDWVRSVFEVHFYDSVVVLDKQGRFRRSRRSSFRIFHPGGPSQPARVAAVQGSSG